MTKRKYKLRKPPHSGSQFVYSYDEYQTKFDEYLVFCIEEDRQPFLMDFASYCGITDQTARNYAKRGDTAEEQAQWQALHDRIVQYSEVEMWQAMLAGKVKEKSAAMFLVNFNKRVASRAHTENKTELEVKAGKGTTLAEVVAGADAGGLSRGPVGGAGSSGTPGHDGETHAPEQDTSA